MDVDGTLAHLLPFVGEPVKARPEPARQEKRTRVRANNTQARQFGKPSAPRIESTEQVSHHSGANDECEDLTEEDLRRLRGDMPLTAKSRKKWQH